MKGWFARNPHIKYIAPAMGVMILLSIIPTLFLIIISATNYQLGWQFSGAKFTGFENFIRLFTGADRDFWHSVWISPAFMLLAAGIEMVFGFLIALLLNSTEFKYKPLIVSIMIVLLAMPPSTAAQMWKLMLNAEYGILNYILQTLFSFKIVWLSPQRALWPVLLVDCWMFTPFVTLIILPAYAPYPPSPTSLRRLTGQAACKCSVSSPCP